MIFYTKWTLSTSPNTLGRNVKEFYKRQISLEEKNQLIEYVKQYVRREEQEFYKSNLNFSTENISFRKTYQKDLMRSKELKKKEIVELYNNLIDYQENEAEIKEFKENLINSFKGYDDSFQKFIKELIKYNDYLRKIDNDKKTFTFNMRNMLPILEIKM